MFCHLYLKTGMWWKIPWNVPTTSGYGSSDVFLWWEDLQARNLGHQLEFAGLRASIAGFSGVRLELEATQNWLNLMMNPVNGSQELNFWLLGCSLCYSDSQMIWTFFQRILGRCSIKDHDWTCFLVTLAAILALNVPLRLHLTAWGSHQRGQHGFGRASASHSLRVGLSSGGPCLNILNVMSTIMTSDNRDMRYAMSWWWLTTQTIFRWIRHVNETWKSDISKKAWDTRPTSIKKCVHPKLHWNDH
jgi:hypothetical protein